MRKILPFLLMITIINVQAQQSISLSLHGKIPANSIIQSDFIAVSAADNFEITPNIQFNKPPRHLLNGAAKALGTGALVWQISNRLGSSAKENGQRTSVLPAIGAGVAVGLPDLVKGFRKNSPPALLYTFYSKDRVLIESKTVYLNKKRTAPIKGIVPVDGFMVVTLINGRELKMVSGDVEVNVKKKVQYRGSMAENMNLRLTGDCLPPVVVCPNPSTDVDEWEEGLTGYRLTCTTTWEPNNEHTDCDMFMDCVYETWDLPDYIEYTFTEYYYEGDCTECEVEVSVWASGNETYGQPTCNDIPNCGDPDPDPDPTPDPESITNEATGPCIKGRFNNILALSTNEGTRNLMENTFGQGRAYDLIFKDSMYTKTGARGETEPPEPGSNDIIIRMSKYELSYASQQYVAASVLHEIYHAYLVTDPNCPQTTQGQHEEMIQNFTDDIANTLKTLFPGMTDQVAWSLALGGYGGIQSGNPTMWNNAINACNCGLTDAIVTHVNTYQKAGLEGTPCQ